MTYFMRDNSCRAVSESNQFGRGEVYKNIEAEGPVHAVCTACMSVYADYLSWANSNVVWEGRPKLVTEDINEATSIVVLGCQVTSDAVLNDLRTIERLQEDHPDAQLYAGGCLACRFDIELPEGVRRVGHLRADGQMIERKDFVTFADPFWVKDFDPRGSELEDGHLFRNAYPLRLSVGCRKKCSYCTIRTTRGVPYTLSYAQIAEEFDWVVNDSPFASPHADVLFVADAPSVHDVEVAAALAILHSHPISIRNVEPDVVVRMRHLLGYLAERGLLRVLHAPIQALDSAVLSDMCRVPHLTHRVVGICAGLRERGTTFTATNIIREYKGFPDPVVEELEPSFDYISWNVYWDGVWDRKEAEERFKRLYGRGA